MMIRPMFIMPCLVLGLALLQLFLYCLMHQLDFLNEVHGFVYVTLSIHDNIFPESNIQRSLRQISKTSFEQQSLCRRMHGMVVGMLYIMLIPNFRMSTAISPKQMYHCYVHHLCLSISLWMKSSAFLQLGVHQFLQTCPKLSKKPGVPI